MNNDIHLFWKNNSLANIKPGRGGEFPEGWDVVDFFKHLYTEKEYGYVIDIGCGYGRLSKAFNPNSYLGVDFSEKAIQLAKNLSPEYNFSVLEKSIEYRESTTKLLYTVLLHQTDEDIADIVKNLCTSSNRVIIAEICGRSWRRLGNPPVFNREYTEYVQLFELHNKSLKERYSKPYTAYTDTNIEILVFQ